jgi:hypothetical protein
MADNCIKFPQVPTLSIPLPMGVELKALVDPSKGPPTNCALVHSLMLQLMPLLAGLTCILRMLNVFAVLKGFVENPLNFQKAGEVVSALAKLVPCFGLVDPLALCRMIKAILQMLLSYLQCILDSIKSILDFQVGIDLNSAQGNPVLLSTLECAQDNAAITLQQLQEAMAFITPLMDLLQPLLEIANLNLTLPSIGDLAGQDAQQTVASMQEAIDNLRQIIDSIPC